MHPRKIHAIAALALCAAAAACPAQPAADGIEWVTISAPGNRGWDRDEDIIGTVVGRGSVGYEYRIARFEITTAQWLEFLNTFTARSDRHPDVFEPIIWSGEPDPFYFGPGTRYRLSPWLPDSAMGPVGGLNWREVARYCNWLHNNKSADHAALADGAYDTSTFGFGEDGNFTDQQQRSPGARYWIPSFDEVWKAVFYDPHLDYWFLYPHASDTPPVPGPPGAGETNAGYIDTQLDVRHMPLGSYPESTSPWGLLDASGAMHEWTEDIMDPLLSVVRTRIFRGAHAGGSGETDRGSGFGASLPEYYRHEMGGRIASAVPCLSDWDRSGGIDGEDIASFFTDWLRGDADIDSSGGTDGDDISDFFARWQSGC